jgi:quinol-cytochrome oxidoreductase complex cytochrome b subunit
MLGAGIAFVIGMLLIISDWRMSTPPDSKTKKRPPLKTADRKRLRDMFFWTIAVSVAVYIFPLLF